VIGRAPRHPNVIFAFGHGHIGLSTGPVTGRIVADLVDGRPPPVPLEPYRPERF
jgi:D-amino-acid dehydrogenase